MRASRILVAIRGIGNSLFRRSLMRQSGLTLDEGIAPGHFQAKRTAIALTFPPRGVAHLRAPKANQSRNTSPVFPPTYKNTNAHTRMSTHGR
jgi:hypothetical protein